MQIVIDISDEDAIFLMESSFIPIGYFNLIHNALHEGIVLPKGHGRLGDLDALQKEVSSWGMNDYEPSDFIDAIDQAQTIIEADKVESEE